MKHPGSTTNPVKPPRTRALSPIRVKPLRTRAFRALPVKSCSSPGFRPFPRKSLRRPGLWPCPQNRSCNRWRPRIAYHWGRTSPTFNDQVGCLVWRRLCVAPSVASVSRKSPRVKAITTCPKGRCVLTVTTGTKRERFLLRASQTLLSDRSGLPARSLRSSLPFRRRGTDDRAFIDAAEDRDVSTQKSQVLQTEDPASLLSAGTGGTRCPCWLPRYVVHPISSSGVPPGGF